MKAKVENEKQTTLHKLAGEVFAAHHFSDASIEVLEKLIFKDNTALKLAVRDAAETALRHRMSLMRSRIIREAATPDRGVGPRIFSREEQEAVGRRGERYTGFMDWPMMNGLRLADETKEHLITAAARFQKNADGNARNAAFLRAVAERLRDGQRVGDVLTERQLRNMMNRVKAGPGLVV